MKPNARSAMSSTPTTSPPWSGCLPKPRRQDRKAEEPAPKGSLAYAAWVFARLGGWTGYYGKPGPIVMIRGLTQFHAIKHGWTLRPAGDEL